MRALNIIAADDAGEVREYYQALLGKLGHQVAVAQSGEQLVELCRVVQPDLIITDIKMGEKDGLAAAEEANKIREVPVVLVSGYHEEELQRRALQDHVMAYLLKPVKEPDLVNAVNLAMLRFEHYRVLRKESADLKQVLEERKVIERAKGAVMRRLKVDEAEAFNRMRKLASTTNAKLIQVARQIVASEDVFAAAEGH